MKHVIICFVFLIVTGVSGYKFERSFCGLSANLVDSASENVQRGDFPWIVAIYYKNSADLNSTYEYICDGTLVSDTKIVTAAKCMRSKETSEPIKPSELSLFLGSHDLNNHFEAGRSISPVWKVAFPEKSDKLNDDIALVVVEEKIQFSKFIRPICLLTEKESTDEGIAVGWSKSAKSSENVPLKLKLKILSKADCLQKNPQLEVINSTYSFCAGASNVEVCTGNSGHGLAVVKDDSYYFKGVLSSFGCENEAVYTDVLPYNEFIKDHVHPCYPSPCGQHSTCKLVDDKPSCSCLQTYIGNPPNCHGECLVNSDCPLDLYCFNRGCQDPCPNVCGEDATCEARNHNPICRCGEGYAGDPFRKCFSLATCEPSPCGKNTMCKIENETAVCTCNDDFYGDAFEGCKSDCEFHHECPNKLRCKDNKCKDPCEKACGINAKCEAINHSPICFCEPGFTGDFFVECHRIEA